MFVMSAAKPSAPSSTTKAPKMRPFNLDGLDAVVSFNGSSSSSGSGNSSSSGSGSGSGSSINNSSSSSSTSNGSDGGTVDLDGPCAFDTDALLDEMALGMSMNDITQSHRRAFDKKKASVGPEAVECPSSCLVVDPVTHQLRILSRRPRKTIQITTSSAGTAGPMGEEGYAEVQEKQVDSFMRTLSIKIKQGSDFYDSCRPAYFGTFTKESAIITARTPFSQDHTLINYDFDSDEDWESDAEGEDIADSDGEEDNEGNELEFDDFFRRDDDFGSDADSDGEEMAIVATRARQGEESIGVRFMRSKQMLRVPMHATVPNDSEGESQAANNTAPISVLEAAQDSIPPAIASTSLHDTPMRVDVAQGRCPGAVRHK